MTEDAPSPIGFIGLGAMGEPMARHLLDRFGQLTVWNQIGRASCRERVFRAV